MQEEEKVLIRTTGREQKEILIDDVADIATKVRDVLTEFADDETVKLVLYRLNNGKKEQVSQMDASSFDPHEVGIKYGGGKYELYIRYKDLKKSNGWGTRTVPFNIADDYNELKRENDLKKTINQMQFNQAPPAQNDFLDKFLLMQEKAEERRREDEKSRDARFNQMMVALVGLAGTILPAIINRPKNDSLAEKILPTLLEGRNQSETKMFEMNMNAFQKGMDLAMQNKPTEENNTTNWLDIVQTLVEKSPMLVEGMGALISAKQVQKQLHSDPQYQQLIQNEQAVKTYLEQLIEKARKIVEKSGILEKAQSMGFFLNQISAPVESSSISTNQGEEVIIL